MRMNESGGGRGVNASKSSVLPRRPASQQAVVHAFWNGGTVVLLFFLLPALSWLSSRLRKIERGLESMRGARDEEK